MLRPVSILLFALSAPLSSQSVWVVDDDAGPGVDFLHPNDALDAAESGDLILIKDGTYGAQPVLPFDFEFFEVDGKSITVVADAGANVTFDQLTITVRNLAPNQKVVLRGLFVGAINGLQLYDNEGTVWVDHCTILGSFGLAATTAILQNSNSVVIQNSTLRGTSGPTGGAGVGRGMHATDSSIHVYESTIAAGVLGFGSLGQPGIEMHGGQLVASGSSFVGTSSINGDQPGILLASGSPDVHLLDTEVLGTPPISNPAGGTVETLTGSAVGLSFASPIRGGETTTLSITGSPGDLILLHVHVNPATPAFYAPSLSGSIVIPLPMLLSVAPGVIPASGVFELPVTLTPTSLQALTFYVQSEVFTTGGELVAGAAGALTLLNNSL